MQGLAVLLVAADNFAKEAAAAAAAADNLVVDADAVADTLEQGAVEVHSLVLGVVDSLVVHHTAGQEAADKHVLMVVLHKVVLLEIDTLGQVGLHHMVALGSLLDHQA